VQERRGESHRVLLPRQHHNPGASACGWADQTESGHLGGPTNQGVAQELDRGLPHLDRRSAAEHTAPGCRESWRGFRTLEQVAGVCEVAGAAAVRAGTVVAHVPVPEAARESALSRHELEELVPLSFFLCDGLAAYEKRYTRPFFVMDWPLTKSGVPGLVPL
jgi:hypothetical protein